MCALCNDWLKTVQNSNSWILGECHPYGTEIHAHHIIKYRQYRHQYCQYISLHLGDQLVGGLCWQDVCVKHDFDLFLFEIFYLANGSDCVHRDVEKRPCTELHQVIKMIHFTRSLNMFHSPDETGFSMRYSNRDQSTTKFKGQRSRCLQTTRTTRTTRQMKQPSASIF